MKQKFSVSGMSCAACSARVEKAVAPIANTVSVNLLAGTMTAEYDVSTQEIIETVKKAGYGCEVFRLKKSDNSAELKEMKVRLIWSFVFLIPLMILSMSHMLGYTLPGILSNHKINGIGQIVFLIPILILNRKFFTNGIKSLIKLSPNMDSLVAVGSGASAIYSVVALFLYSAHELYFESAGMILTLITLGKFLETKSKGKTKEAVNKLIDLTPEKSIVLLDGMEKEILSAEIVEGQTVVIKPGVRIPVDGVIISGNGDVDQSAVTGESMPVSLGEGDRVISGTVNRNGNFTFRATDVGTDTTLARIIELVETASSTKAPAQRLADKIAAIFVPVVMAIALVTFVTWLLLGYGFEFAFTTGIAVLVISCPCALGLATPVAIMVATGKGAENGLLFKDAASLETLGRVDAFVFDKTGTITEGTPKVTDVKSDNLLDIAYTLESISEHPLSRAVCEYCEANGAKKLELKESEYVIGKGIIGNIDGVEYRAGNKALTGFENTELAAKGKTPIIFTKNGEYIGTVAVADVIREDAKEAMASIDAETIMLTGDNEITAAAIVSEVGIKQFIANAMPDEKEGKIKELIDSGKTVAMIGDGINDAPALTRADVGIAIGAGSDIAIESADVVLMSSRLTDVVKAIKLSRKTLKNIRENLFWAFFYNCLGIPLAAGVLFPITGWLLNPMIAAACMSFSSVTVVLNALRLRKFKG